jgi:hypothetical protein
LWCGQIDLEPGCGTAFPVRDSCLLFCCFMSQNRWRDDSWYSGNPWLKQTWKSRGNSGSVSDQDMCASEDGKPQDHSRAHSQPYSAFASLSPPDDQFLDLSKRHILCPRFWGKGPQVKPRGGRCHKGKNCPYSHHAISPSELLNQQCVKFRLVDGQVMKVLELPLRDAVVKWFELKGLPCRLTDFLHLTPLTTPASDSGLHSM